jgi:hypothetical protein
MSIFKDEELQEQNIDVTAPQEDIEELEESYNITISTESPKEKAERKGVKVNADSRILTIKDWDFTKPRTKTLEGEKIEPKLTLTAKVPFYPGKLILRFEEDNIVEYYPTIRYFVNNGKISTNVKLPRDGDGQVALIVNKVLKQMGMEENSEEVSDADILDFLKGKKVKIKTDKGKYLGKEWFRNDIEEFVD